MHCIVLSLLVKQCMQTCLHIGSLDVYNILKSKPIAEKLMTVGSNDIQGVFNRYIHDFVLFTCGLSQENDDTKVVLLFVVLYLTSAIH